MKHRGVHTHLAPQLRHLMVDERVAQISDHQLATLDTDNQEQEVQHLLQVSSCLRQWGAGLPGSLADSPYTRGVQVVYVQPGPDEDVLDVSQLQRHKT